MIVTQEDMQCTIHGIQAWITTSCSDTVFCRISHTMGANNPLNHIVGIQYIFLKFDLQW